jgi:hypothetical protein
MKLRVTLDSGVLTSSPLQRILNNDGDVAQLGERLNGIQEVRGSNPLISTTEDAILSNVLYDGT